MSRHEYNLLQWAIPAFRGNWEPQVCDVLPGRPLDRKMPRTTEPIDWDALPHPRSREVADDRIGHDRPWTRPQTTNNLGRAMQRAHPTKRKKFTIGTSTYGYYKAHVAVPFLENGYWVEGNPQPNWLLNGDQHVILVGDEPDEDGVLVWEMIGVKVLPWGNHAAGLGRWDEYGNLVFPEEDRGVVWTKTQMSSQMAHVGDPPHRLALVVQGNDLEDPFFPWADEWLVLDEEKAPHFDRAPMTPTERMIYDSYRDYGVVVTDHGGHTNVSGATGLQWDLARDSIIRQVKLRHFKRVTS